MCTLHATACDGYSQCEPSSPPCFPHSAVSHASASLLWLTTKRCMVLCMAVVQSILMQLATRAQGVCKSEHSVRARAATTTLDNRIRRFGHILCRCPTSFPHATLMGGSFNRSLWRAVASAISDEGRALHQTNGYALITWAPDINPFRDPRWGRGQVS